MNVFLSRVFLQKVYNNDQNITSLAILTVITTLFDTILTHIGQKVSWKYDLGIVLLDINIF
jgi:hypothetical protein